MSKELRSELAQLVGRSCQLCQVGGSQLPVLGPAWGFWGRSWWTALCTLPLCST